jgi:hypothetical protein
MATADRPSVRDSRGTVAPPVCVASVVVDADCYLDAFLWLLSLDSDEHDSQANESDRAAA